MSLFTGNGDRHVNGCAKNCPCLPSVLIMCSFQLDARCLLCRHVGSGPGHRRPSAGGVGGLHLQPAATSVYCGLAGRQRIHLALPRPRLLPPVSPAVLLLPLHLSSCSGTQQTLRQGLSLLHHNHHYHRHHLNGDHTFF